MADGDKKTADLWKGAKTINDEVLPKLKQTENIEDFDIEAVAGLLIGLLSNNPDTAKVRCEKLHQLTVLTFDLTGGNQGRVIGKNGHTIKAIRSICKSVERSRGRDVIIEIPGYND
jgi:predicted RNA-binding protein YlqC (UPF0109 family)